MLFNSFAFVAFFVVVTTLFFVLPHSLRWLLLLLASCFFYMFFVPIFILILAVTIIVDYSAAILIENTSSQRKKKFFLSVSIVSVCTVLFVFKYFNFFNANFAALAAALDWNYSIAALSIALPIGLSFHTFQSSATSSRSTKVDKRQNATSAFSHFMSCTSPSLLPDPSSGRSTCSTSFTSGSGSIFVVC